MMQEAQASCSAETSGRAAGHGARMGRPARRHKQDDAGSAGVMQRGEIQVGRQDMAARIGAGSGAATMMMAGSSETMELSQLDTTNDITHGAEAGKPRSRPPPPKPKRKNYKTAAWDYVPAEDDELAMTAGDKIEMIEPLDEDWAKGKNMRSGEVGLYPITYVE